MKNYNFMEKRKTAFIIAAVVLVLGIASMLIRGFNLDIDFAGGSELTLDIKTNVNDKEISTIKDIVKNAIGEHPSSVAKTVSNNNQVIIKTKELSNDEIDAIFDGLKAKYEAITAEEFDSVQNVGSTVSGDTQKTAIISSLVAVLLILVYITIRFQFTSGLASVVCLAFNIFTMLAFYSLIQIPVNSNLIAACLTILGYSINATIVIFDRIRENTKKSNGDFSENANTAIHQTLGRSINTTITTLLTIGMVYILGVDSIKNFALPIIIGIVAGVFSSIFLGGPLWDIFNKVFASKKNDESKKLNTTKAKKA